jgi:glycosyltransferase involved in cell wall biosynthesis
LLIRGHKEVKHLPLYIVTMITLCQYTFVNNLDPCLAVIVPVYNEEFSIAATLDALYRQEFTGTAEHVIVDNGSTDNTQAVIRRFAKEHDGFPLRVIEEPQKGTGAAADTGVCTTIENGATVVARTDADTVPRSNWTNIISSRFSGQTDMQLLTGRITALHDRNYRRGDSLLMPVSVRGARIALALSHLDAGYLRAATGGNMATRAQAYESVGGFPRTSIDKLDEDIAYSLQIARKFGRRAITIDNNLVVETSMRRIRAQGWGGTALHHLLPERRQRSGQQLDVR